LDAFATGLFFYRIFGKRSSLIFNVSRLFWRMHWFDRKSDYHQNFAANVGCVWQIGRSLQDRGKHVLLRYVFIRHYQLLNPQF
jgi:hypothetical protein